MPGELYQIYANKTIINEKRTAIKGSGFRNDSYWCSRETSSNNNGYVYINSGSINYGDKTDAIDALGFLALEY